MLRVSELLALLDEVAAFSLAESWDNVGLMVGDPDGAVDGILVCLDASLQVLQEATEKNCNVILSHHPLIFQPLKALRTDDPVSALAVEAAKRGFAIISCHTNLDVVTPGVSDALAAALGVADGEPLAKKEGEAAVGFGKIGSLRQAAAGDDFIRMVLDSLSLPSVKVAGRLPELVQKIAVCGGSGSDLVKLAHARGADLYVTGEVKHSAALWAKAKDFCVIDAGHYATEQVVVPVLAGLLAGLLEKRSYQVLVAESLVFFDPFTYFGKRGEEYFELS
jgi:dinuclear metal center YbgI/SA1388 family protein